MPSTVSAIRRVPWKKVWISAVWLYHQGRSRLERNLTPAERSELWELMKRSKGRPNNLTKRQRDRFRDLVGRGARGS